MGGGRMPSMVSSLFASDCRNGGKLFCELILKNALKVPPQLLFWRVIQASLSEIRQGTVVVVN